MKDPDSLGFWETACGELYFFGKVLVNSAVHVTEQIFKTYFIRLTGSKMWSNAANLA